MNVLERPAVRLSEAEETLVALMRRVGAGEAAERFAARGLPTRRIEAYHYTDLKALLREVPDRLASKGTGQTGDRGPLRDAVRVLIANGSLIETDKLPAGIAVSQGKAGEAPSGWTGTITSALAPQAVRLALTASTGKTVHIDRRVEGEACVAASRVEIEVGEGVSATVIGTSSGSDASHLCAEALAVRLAAGASLTFVEIDGHSPQVQRLVDNDFALGADATLRTLTVNAGAGINRVNLAARFDGAGAHADFTGLNLVEGEQHADITLDVSHAVANTTSQELYKSVARDRATAVFQGKIVVERHAQKTDAKMMAQGLLLGERAQIQHKPELEIFADDVVCGHGATCGALDESALFYLMSRGIGRQEAESMLIRAFLAELFDPIDNEMLRGVFDTLVDRWLGSGLRAAA